MDYKAIASDKIGVNLEALTKRIVRKFDKATPRDIEAGARWYDEARLLAIELSTEYDYTVEQIASAIAALSPQLHWSANVAATEQLLANGTRKPGVLGRSFDNAKRALTDGFSAVTGQKTSIFARNITGDDEAVTIDVWACRVAGIDEKLLNRVGVYATLAYAYQTAARRRGVSPSTMQATTWVVARGRAS
jgi:hypothetical protein